MVWGASGMVKVFDKEGNLQEGFTNYFAFSPDFKGGAKTSFGGYLFNSRNGFIQDSINGYRLYFAAGPGGGAQVRYSNFIK